VEKPAKNQKIFRRHDGQKPAKQIEKVSLDDRQKLLNQKESQKIQKKRQEKIK
jgi:hypothetical protein